MTFARHKGSTDRGEAQDETSATATALPVGQLPPQTAIASCDARAVALLRDAVRQVFPDTIMHMAGAPAPVRQLLSTVRPALVLLDLNFMEPSAGDLITEAHGVDPRILVVVVAGHGDDDRILPALRSGAAGVVVKYDTPDVIAAQLRNVAAGVLPLTPGLARQAIRHADRGGPGAALTASEWELLAWVAAGDTLGQAAERTGQTPEEIREHVDHIYQRLALRGRGLPAPRAALHAGAGEGHE